MMSELAETMKEWRHRLHQYPETAFEEVQTSAFVAERLREMGLQVQEHVGKTGVVATLRAGEGTRVIGLRSDMDALNLREAGDPPYKSRRDGKMHACGHDGHMATLLGAARMLSERRDFSGTVRFVFQPAEEPGKGAQAMLDDGLLERFPMDEIYGLHNMPDFLFGTVHTRRGGFCSSEDDFRIDIHGRGAHSASPHLAADPLLTAAEILLALQTIVSRSVDPTQTAVLSCTELHTDGAQNTLPTNAFLLGDARCYSPETRALIEARMRSICGNLAAMNGAACTVRYTHAFAPTVNWPECTDAAIRAASEVFGPEHVDGSCPPDTGAEDFGRFLEKIPGCFVFLGSRAREEDPICSTHSIYFDYNDDLLEPGAEYFAQLIRDRLPL